MMVFVFLFLRMIIIFRMEVAKLRDERLNRSILIASRDMCKYLGPNLIKS